jgi:hypothetical protein
LEQLGGGKQAPQARTYNNGVYTLITVSLGDGWLIIYMRHTV